MRRDIFFSLSITESSSSIMDMLSVQAVLVAQSAVLLDGLDGIIHSHSKPQALPCKKLCWDIDNSFISNNQVENNLINELNNDDDILVDSVQSDGDIEKVDLDTFVRPPNESKITSKEISEDLLVAHSNSFNMIKT